MGAIVTGRGFGRGGYGRRLLFGRVYPNTELTDAPLWRKPGGSLTAPALARRHEANMRREQSR